MKKLYKIILIIALTILGAVSFVGCKGCNGGGQSADDPNDVPNTEKVYNPYLTVKNKSLELLLGERAKLGIRYGDGKEEDTLKFVVDNDNVTVANDGTVTAVLVGKSTIEITYSGVTEYVTVTVGTDDIVPSFEFDYITGNSVSVAIDDKLGLSAKIKFNKNYYEDAEYEHQVGDETIGRIDNGVFIPLKLGTTFVTTTAKWRNFEGDILTETIEITVVAEKVEENVNIIPQISFQKIEDGLQQIRKDECLDLSTKVFFNGNYYTDTIQVYEVEDQELGSVINGKFVPSGQKTGYTDITVKTSWRMFEEVTQTLTVQVISAVDFTLNENLSKITLYTLPEFEGKNYATSLNLNLNVMVDGIPYSSDVGIEIENNDSNVVELNGNTLNSLHYGEAKLIASITDEDGVQHTKSYEITVVRPTAVSELETIDFYGNIGTLPLAEIFGKEVEIIEAVSNFTTDDLTVEYNRIRGFDLRDNQLTERRITVYTADRGYTIKVIPYAALIRNATDLSVLSLNYDKQNPSSCNLYGYYVLANNIDANGYAHAHGGDATGLKSGTDYGFKGVFDGRGYTIDGITLSYGGLFLSIGVNAIIKNVAFTNVHFNDTSSTIKNFVLAYNIYGEETNGVNFENLYIKVDTLTTPNVVWKGLTSAAVVAYDCRFATFNGVIIEYGEDISKKGPNDKDFLYGSFIAFKRRDGIRATNTYIISPTVLQYSVLADGTTSSIENELISKCGIVRYTDNTAFKNASVNMDAFGSTHWEVKDGIPVWKNLPKPTTNLDEVFYADATSAIITLPKAVTTVNSVSMNGEIVTDYIFASGALTIPASVYANVEVGTNCSFSIDADDMLYRATVKRVTKVIKTASDLAVLQISSYTAANSSAGTLVSASLIEGYYVLGGNIDASLYDYKHGINTTNIEIGSDYGFRGVFDGCGYTIDGLNLDRFGLFGIVGAGAEIKNVALTNVKFTNTSANGRHYVLASSIKGTSASKVNISNVYIKIDTLTTKETAWTSETYAAVVALLCNYTTFDGVIIDYNENLTAEVPDEKNCLYGSFVANKNLTGITATNTYVISPTKLQNKQSDGSSEEETLIRLGVIRCENAEVFNSAMEDTEKLNAFNNEYWDITGGVPVWKTFVTE